MIHTAAQLKALVRNKSKGNSAKAQVIIRNYVMERFLERLSLSPYRDHLILKGGILVSALVGLDNRSTMDIDATFKNLPLSEASAREVVEDIAAIEFDDGIVFTIESVGAIMDEADYPGVRVILKTMLGDMRTPLKLDFSTGDVITPREMTYSFKLMFENRTIPILAYNLETVLAEKLETMLSRGTVNTRMRDFYDVFILEAAQMDNIDAEILSQAFGNTSEKRRSAEVMREGNLILGEIESSPEMQTLWRNYQRKYEFAAGVEWHDALMAAKSLYERIRAGKSR